MSFSVVPGFYSWLRVTPEFVGTSGTYGTYNASATPQWIRLTGDNAFSPSKTEPFGTLRSADTQNRRVQRVMNPIHPKHEVSATLHLPFYPSLAGFILDAACKQLATPTPNLMSYTFDFFPGYLSNATTIRRYLGGMVGQFDLSCEAESQQANTVTKWVFQTVDDITLTAITGTGTNVLAPPAETVFPTESPYVLSELTGKFKVAASPSTPAAPNEHFDKLSLSVKNVLAHGFFDQPYISFCQYAGRDVDLSTHLTLQDSTWRDYYEAQTALNLSAEFFRSSTPNQNCTLTFNTVNYVVNRTEEHPLGGVLTQGADIQCFYDPSVSADFSYLANWATS